MTRQRKSRNSTPLALIEAAERLFGTHGIEGVSLRQIRVEAGAANNSAITYHFKEREDLVQAIWEYRLPILDAERQVFLDELYASGNDKDAHAVLRVLIMPSYNLRDAQGAHRYGAFFRHALRWKRGKAIRVERLDTTPASSEALRLYHALAPDVSPELLDYRLRYGSCMFFDMIFDRDDRIAEGLPVPDEEEFLEDGIDGLVQLCLRPSAEHRT